MALISEGAAADRSSVYLDRLGAFPAHAAAAYAAFAGDVETPLADLATRYTDILAETRMKAAARRAKQVVGRHLTLP